MSAERKAYGCIYGLHGNGLLAARQRDEGRRAALQRHGLPGIGLDGNGLQGNDLQAGGLQGGKV